MPPGPTEVRSAGRTALRPRSVPGTALLALCVVLAACGSDAASQVRVHNATDIPVVLLQTGTVPNASPPPIPYRVEPGDTFTNNYWRRPFGSKEPPATVRAEDLNGTLIFCRRYSYKEIQDASFRIEIVRGDIRCGQSGRAGIGPWVSVERVLDDADLLSYSDGGPWW